jgi:hypothetical protein
MIMKIPFATVGVSLFLSLGAVGEEKPPVALKHAVLQTIELSTGQHVFGKHGKTNGKKGLTIYAPVEIRGRILADGSIKVVFQPIPLRGMETAIEAFSAEFSASSIRTRPAQRVPVTPGVSPEDERKIRDAVKVVMTKYLSENETKVSLMVDVFQENQEYTIIVSPLPLTPGGHRTFVVNEKYQIKNEWLGK